MDINSLLELDRQLLHTFNGSNSLFLDSLMTILTSGLTWIPLYISLLYLIIKNNDTAGQIVLIICCSFGCVLLADGMAEFIAKPIVGRLRPCNDPMIKYTIDTVSGINVNDFSFFSAHAANTFSLAMFFSLLVRNKALTTCLILWSLINCYTRLYLGVHYPSDVAVGLLWGGVVGACMYYIYKKIYKKISSTTNYISTQYTSTGYSFANIYVVLNIFVFTLCYAIIKALII